MPGPGPRTGMAFAARVRSNPGFRAFAAVIGLRITNGHALDALYMLRAIGCTDEIAYKIADEWPTKKNSYLEAAGLTLAEEAACRFACFIDDLEKYDWPSLLRRALVDAELARRTRRHDGA